MKMIDFEAHYYTPELMKLFSTRSQYPIYIPENYELRLSDDFVIKDKYKMTMLSAPFEERIQEMDRFGVDMQILSLSPGIDFLDVKESVKVAREANDYVYKAMQQFPGRFSGYAALPMYDTEASVDELERCVKDLGFFGWMTFSNVGPACPDDDRFEKIFAKAAELNVPVYIHPNQPYEGRLTGLGPQLAGASFGFGIDTAITLIRLIYKGIFDRYPNLKVMTGHLGEGIPFYLKRMDERGKNYLARKAPAQNKELPGYYFKKNIWVSTSGQYSLEAFRCTQDVLGIDHILFGSDYPYELPGEVKEFTRQLCLSEIDREKLLYRNAEDLFGSCLYRSGHDLAASKGDGQLV
jgi:predicted TIM-barrel fold metal-dependent hydrolase